MQRDGTQSSTTIDLDLDPQPNGGPKGGRGHETTRKRQETRLAILFLLPALAVYLAFMVYPFFSTVYLSLTNWNGVAEAKDFVGFSNYGRMFGDGDVLKAFANNVIWVVLGTIVPVVIGLVLSILIWSGVRGSLFFRTIFFLPFVLPLVVVGLVWQWIYHPLYGVVNKALDGVGLDGVSRAWLGEPGTALYAVLIAAIWATFGFVVMILLAALQNVAGGHVVAPRAAQPLRGPHAQPRGAGGRVVQYGGQGLREGDGGPVPHEHRRRRPRQVYPCRGRLPGPRSSRRQQPGPPGDGSY